MNVYIILVKLNNALIQINILRILKQISLNILKHPENNLSVQIKKAFDVKIPS